MPRLSAADCKFFDSYSATDEIEGLLKIGRELGIGTSVVQLVLA
jgi:hypothetical protein